MTLDNPDAASTLDSETTLLKLYEWYKQEVYKRRETMMRLTVSACAFNTAVLLIVYLFANENPSTSITLFLCFSVIITNFAFVFLIKQQKERHQDAKLALIEVERELGLFNGETFNREEALVPLRWQSDWMKDKSLLTYLALITLSGLLTLIGILALS